MPFEFTKYFIIWSLLFYENFSHQVTNNRKSLQKLPPSLPPSLASLSPPSKFSTQTHTLTHSRILRSQAQFRPPSEKKKCRSLSVFPFPPPHQLPPISLPFRSPQLHSSPGVSGSLSNSGPSVYVRRHHRSFSLPKPPPIRRHFLLLLPLQLRL